MVYASGPGADRFADDSFNQLPPDVVVAAAATDAGPLSTVVTASDPFLVAPAAIVTFSGLAAPIENGLSVTWTLTETGCPPAGVMTI